MTTAAALAPRIYVACLASYNQGLLHGGWIDATQGEWAIWSGIQTMLAGSPVADAEEFAIHDYEGFGGAAVGECAGIAAVVRLANFVKAHGAMGCAVLNYYGGDIAEAEEALRERYLGCWSEAADYFQEIGEETLTIPEPLRPYIDWGAMARDAELNGEILSIAMGGAEVHLFAAA